jgi:glucan phosphoethanolaminetransferase (alkaline phosphatase superfamily)
MKKDKSLNNLFLVLLSFLVSYNVPVAFAQINAQSNTDSSTANPNPVLFFSLGLLSIAFLIFLVLYFNRDQGKAAIEKGQFEFQRLNFAAVILMGLALVFLESMAMYYWSPPSQVEVGKNIFETCKTVIPPIITLVLGYYFGRSDLSQASQDKNRENTSEKKKPEDDKN